MRSLAAIFIVIALALSGCASVPLITALKLSTLQPRDLAQVDPSEVRVKVSVPAGFQLDVDDSRLSLSLKTRNGKTQHHEMALSLLQVARENRPTGLFSGHMAVSTYTLALSPSGVSKLRSAQQFVLTEDPNAFEFGVNAPLAKTPARVREITFWADVRLSNKEPYMPLIDGAKIRLQAAGAGS